MPEDPLQVAIIVGSTREGRFDDTVARWFTTQARQHDDMALDVIDLVNARNRPHQRTRERSRSSTPDPDRADP